MLDTIRIAASHRVTGSAIRRMGIISNLRSKPALAIVNHNLGYEYWDQPEATVADVRQFFRKLRTWAQKVGSGAFATRFGTEARFGSRGEEITAIKSLLLCFSEPTSLTGTADSRVVANSFIGAGLSGKEEHYYSQFFCGPARRSSRHR